MTNRFSPVLRRLMPGTPAMPRTPAKRVPWLTRLREAAAALRTGAAVGGVAAGLVLSMALAPAAAQAADVGVSVAISQPGVYGRIDIGRFPQPQVVVQQPVIVYPAARRAAPVYIYAPPGHRKHWGKHCDRYGACNVPVYFVTDRWYQQRVQPVLAAYPGVRYGHWHDPRRDARPVWVGPHGHHHRDDRRDGYRGDRRWDDHGGRAGGRDDHRHGDDRKFRGPPGRDR